MATLSAMFRLFDGYSSTVNKIITQTDKAAKAILGASKENDKYNESLKATGAISSTASNGIAKLIGTVASLAAVQKGLNLTDTYVNTNARLAMITDSMEEQKTLQQDIFAAAGRARGNYDAMANSAAKLSMLAGDSFGSNQEALAFTELLTKSLKVSGASQTEQDSAFLQLTQAMTAGKLQGDEFRSIMENAPMVADAIAAYMGKSKSELKELSSQGLITADIIKGAMFVAADDINGKFDTMPMTFADIWNRIKNAGTRAFGEVFEKANNMLNSDFGQTAVANLAGLVHLAAGAFSVLLDGIGWAGNHLDMLTPVVFGLVTAWMLYNTVAGISSGIIAAATMAETAHAASAAMAAGATFLWTVEQYGLNAALAACPITWVVAGVLLLIAAFYAGVAAVNHFAGTSISATGMIVGALFTAGAVVGNLFIGLYNAFMSGVVDVTNLLISFGEFFANFLNDPALAIEMLVWDVVKFSIDSLGTLAKTIDTIFGSDLSSIVTTWSSAVDNLKADLITDSTITYERIDKAGLLMDRLNYGDAFSKGYGVGEAFVGSISSYLNGFDPNATDSVFDVSQFATAGNPAVIKGTGKGGAIKVENEEDLEWMRRLAERDYVARIAQNTLAPNIHVEFTGPIANEADTDSVMAHVAEQLKEIIASAPEGVPE